MHRYLPILISVSCGKTQEDEVTADGGEVHLRSEAPAVKGTLKLRAGRVPCARKALWCEQLVCEDLRMLGDVQPESGVQLERLEGIRLSHDKECGIYSVLCKPLADLNVPVRGSV